MGYAVKRINGAAPKDSEPWKRASERDCVAYAVMYLQEKDYEAARTVVNYILKMAPSSPIAPNCLHVRAICEYNLLKYDEARATLAELKSRFPNYAPPREGPTSRIPFPASTVQADLLQAGREAYDRGDTEKADRIYSQFLVEYADSPRALEAAYYLTLCAYRAQDYEAALTGVGCLLTNYPDHPVVPCCLHLQAMCEIQLGRFENAEAALTRIQIDYPDYAPDQIKQLLERLPDATTNEDRLIRLGRAAFARKEYPAAMRCCSRYLRDYPRAPGAPEAGYTLALCQYEMKSYERALEDARRALAEYPDGGYAPYCLRLRAQCEIRLSRFQDARATLSVLQSKYPGYEPAKIEALLRELPENNG